MSAPQSSSAKRGILPPELEPPVKGMSWPTTAPPPFEGCNQEGEVHCWYTAPSRARKTTKATVTAPTSKTDRVQGRWKRGGERDGRGTAGSPTPGGGERGEDAAAGYCPPGAKGEGESLHQGIWQPRGGQCIGRGYQWEIAARRVGTVAAATAVGAGSTSRVGGASKADSGDGGARQPGWRVGGCKRG